MRVQNILASGFAINALGALISGSGALAQVSNADLVCYLNTPDGVQFDLRALCGDYEEPEEIVLQTGDVQVTLRWDTSDDLDLYVRDPNGDEVYFGNQSVPSGGILDVDANAGCDARMAAPVENIFWPPNQGAPGDYVVTVDLFSYCGAENPINFTITTLVQGVTQSQSGTVSAEQRTASFPFSFPPAGSAPAETALPTGATTALPAVP